MSPRTGSGRAASSPGTRSGSALSARASMARPPSARPDARPRTSAAGSASLARRDLGQQLAVAGVGDVVGTGEEEHPTGNRVGRTIAPGSAGGGAVVAGGQIGDGGGEVVIAADADDERHPLAAGLRQGGEDGRCHGVGDGGDGEARPRPSRGITCGQRIGGQGHGTGIVAADPLGAQARQLGHEHQEAVIGERPGERDQAGVVTPERGDAWNHHDTGARFIREVEVAELAGEGHAAARAGSFRRGIRTSTSGHAEACRTRPDGRASNHNRQAWQPARQATGLPPPSDPFRCPTRRHPRGATLRAAT